VRFVFVDRIVDLAPGKSIHTVKNVSASEDYFEDHFPGMPIMPGALILECFIQSAMLMLGAVDDFASRPAVRRIGRATFKHVVRPGDRLAVQCESDARWSVRARATVGERMVATAVMEFERRPRLSADNPLRSLFDVLRRDPGEVVAGVSNV
jgi:3-hydroxyacyl-[acyl-carrier-protein] dehydratase